MAWRQTSAPAPRGVRTYPPVHVGLDPTPGSCSAVERAFGFSAFALLLLSYVALPSLKIAGLPLRGILAVGLLLFLLMAHPAVAERALRKYRMLVVLAGGFAVIGIFTSTINGASLDVIFQSLIEVHLQTIVLILVASILAELCGPRACVVAIVGIIGASTIVAVLQMVGFDPAWNLRQSLGPLSHEELKPTTIDRRPTGLSYSPIQLSTQLCLAFAAFAAVRNEAWQRTLCSRTADPAIILAVAILIAASVVTATRSPILGGVIFLGIYLALQRGSWVPFAIALVGALLYFAWPLIMSAIQSHAPRVIRVDDNSAAARSVFVYYGTRLFLANPLGYGFAFQASELWGPYWSDLYMMRGARGTQLRALHNYPLSMINIYGIGILLLVPLVVRLLRQAAFSMIFFVPYAVHIMFHNSGPFFSDTIIWFVIAAIGAATRSGDRVTEPKPLPQQYRGGRIAGVASPNTLPQPVLRPRA